MVRGKVTALPQNEQVQIGPFINKPLYITHLFKVGPCLYVFIHQDGHFLELLASFITLASRSM